MIKVTLTILQMSAMVALGCPTTEFEASPEGVGFQIEGPKLVAFWARHYGMDPVVACEIVRLESDWNTWASGDHNQSCGWWQFKLKTWRGIRQEMGVRNSMDLRFDPFESTVAACYAMICGNRGSGYRHWWTTYEQAVLNVGGKMK